MTNTIQEIIKNNRAWYCLDCGKCSAVCPITHWQPYGYTSPRLLVEKVAEGHLDEILALPGDELLWTCLTCKRCTELCPSGVSFSEFIRDMRNQARGDGHTGYCTHSAVIQTWGHMMTQPDLQQNRLAWLSDDLKTSESSDTLFFVGCLPYYDVMFKKLDIDGIKIAQAAVKILNHLGIEPQVLSGERCCGHDQLWQGDFDTFHTLARLNLEQLKASGAKRIVTTCPECARTLKLDYAQFGYNHGMQVLHMTELLASLDPAAYLSPTRPPMTVTYQDPCRLGRHLGVYDPPRKVLTDLGFELLEMEQTRHASLCCGTSCWTSCGQVSKNIQVERLKQARATGAELLVTTCHKCQIHFKCAQDNPHPDEKIAMEIHDLTTLVAERL
jgi:heterodisulfide reductase subunit D